jgi:hypothetical protein
MTYIGMLGSNKDAGYNYSWHILTDDDCTYIFQEELDDSGTVE